jgi:hypothetical protein
MPRAVGLEDFDRGYVCNVPIRPGDRAGMTQSKDSKLDNIWRGRYTCINRKSSQIRYLGTCERLTS